MTKRRISLLILWLISLFPVSRAFAQGEPRPWWDDFPLIAEVWSRELPPHLVGGANVVLSAGQLNPGFGTYGQIVHGDPFLVPAFQSVGVRTLGYWEAFGTASCFVGELGARQDAFDYIPLVAHNWNWWNYSGGPIVWVGPQSFFDDEEYARPYTRNHPRYSGPPMTYPDGRVASGYTGDPKDPRTSRVLDAASSKNVLGILVPQPVEPVAVDPNTGLPKMPLDGLLLIDGRYTGNMGFPKDAACPAWIGYQRASSLMAADAGLNGITADNFSAFDGLGSPPVMGAFGEWSVATFRSFLSERFPADTLKAWGIPDLGTFDIRTALRKQVVDWGGNDKDFDDARWVDARWLDYPLWQAYLIHKRQSGTKALTEWYEATKSAAEQAGVHDFVVQGNDIPFYSLGWVRGNLDQVATEMTSEWAVAAGSRGITLPPRGRFAPVFKLAREHARSRFVTARMHIPAEHQGRAGVADALYYEMLATHALPIYLENTVTEAGTPEQQGAFFRFVRSIKDRYGDRMPVADVGVYYSSSSVLAFTTPGGFVDLERQPHQFAHWGWGTALTELHQQYVAIPEWKLTPQRLSGLRVLIVPDSDVFDLADVQNVVEPWVRRGGLLVVTGKSGIRRGESGNFAVNSDGSSFKSVTGVADPSQAPSRRLQSLGEGRVLYIRDNIGMSYYLDDKRENLSLFSDALRELLDEKRPLLVQADTVPRTVGLTLYEWPEARRLFIDLNNTDLDLVTDVVNQAPGSSFTVAAPRWLLGRSIRVTPVSPDVPPTVSATMGDRIRVTIGSFQRYTGIIFEDAGPLPRKRRVRRPLRTILSLPTLTPFHR
ncbi:MAG: hypothetical protein EHM61_04350 [Acidobacteria bacterium]|nr:MAG: hypothetical protein EHM61_04350 [Acidobacteriota bacterium]